MMRGGSKVGADKSDKTFWAGYSTHGNREGVSCDRGDKEKGGTCVCVCVCVCVLALADRSRCWGCLALFDTV